MFKVEIERSSDPVLSFLLSDPGKIFGRPFGGYLLFLFGEADAEIATWFARHLVALDSLTGEDIACAIVARRIRVRSERAHVALPRPRPPLRKTRGGDIYLEDINLEAGMDSGRAQRLVDEGQPRWRGDTREIVAVTLAADEIARALGVMDHLPCMVVVDGIPGLDQYLVPLPAEHVHELVPLLRRVVQRLRRHQAFSSYLEEIRIASSLVEDLRRLHAELKHGGNRLRGHDELYRSKQKAIRSAYQELRKRVEAVSPRRLLAAFLKLHDLDLTRPDLAPGELQQLKEELQKLNRAIGTLRYRSASREAVDQEQARLKSLYQEHLQSLFPGSSPPPERVTQETCHDWLRMLQEIQSGMAKRMLALLPAEEELLARLEWQMVPEMTRLREELAACRRQLEVTRSKISPLLADCIAPDHPSLTAIFQEEMPRGMLDLVRVDWRGGQQLFKAHPLARPAELEYRLQGLGASLAPRGEANSFDVFLCHNSADKEAVKRIAHQLRATGLRPWLDEWELRPGLPFRSELEQQIRQARAAAVFFGAGGTGAWQEMELDALLAEFARSRRPLIPVLLPSLTGTPTLPLFLERMMWVDFRKTDPDPLRQLLWGITGNR